MALNGYLLNRKRRKRNRQRYNRSTRAKIEPRTTHPYQGRLIECRSHGQLDAALPVAPCTGQRAKVGVACTGQRGRTAECRAFNAESRVTFNSGGSVHDPGSKHGPEIMVSPATRCKVDNMLKVLQMNLTHLGPSKIKWLLSQNLLHYRHDDRRIVLQLLAGVLEKGSNLINHRIVRHVELHRQAG